MPTPRYDVLGDTAKAEKAAEQARDANAKASGKTVTKDKDD